MTCTQPLLIHADGTASCAVPGCLARDTLTEAVRRHRYVVNCQAVLGTRCEVCHRSEAGGLEARPSAEDVPNRTDSMCPGTVIVHVDLTVECSVPGCRVSPSSRGAWLAKHADIRSCSDLREACPQCTVGTDHR